MGAGTLFCAVMAVAALCMPFNRMAIVVVASWLVGQYVWMLGFQPTSADLWVNAAALVISAYIAYLSGKHSDRIVAPIFLLMVTVNWVELNGMLHPYYCWWVLFHLGTIQVIALIFGNDWTVLKRIDDWIMARIVRHFGEAL